MSGPEVEKVAAKLGALKTVALIVALRLTTRGLTFKGELRRRNFMLIQRLLPGFY
jgi:hypothetical protein